MRTAFAERVTQYNVEITEALSAAKLVRNQLTHLALAFHVFVTPYTDNGVSGTNGRPVRWVTLRGLSRLSISTAHRKVLSAALAARTGR